MLLPFNFSQLNALRAGHLYALLALPCATLVVAVVPFGSVSANLPLALEPFKPAILLPLEMQKLISGVAALIACTMAAIGYLLGWLLNAFVLRVACAYPWPVVRSIILQSSVPTTWARPGTHQLQGESKVRDREHWEAIKPAGPFRFIVLRGGVAFGTFAFVLLHIVHNLLYSQPILVTSLPFKFLFWFLCGVALSGSRWLWLSRRAKNEA